MHLFDKFSKETFGTDGIIKDFALDYPENYNFGYDVVDEMARIAPSQRAMVWLSGDGKKTREFTFEEISKLSNKAANVFYSHGVRKGDSVLVILKRHYEYWYVAPALHKLGAVMIPATHMLTEEDLLYRINSANVKSVISTPDGNMAETLLKVQKECVGLENIFVVRRELEGTINFTDEMDKASDLLLMINGKDLLLADKSQIEIGDPKQGRRIKTLASEPMLMYFTSGTTGQPKAVIHNHTYSLAHIVTARYWQCVKDEGLHLTVAETGWGKASWGKIYGQWLCGCAIMVYDFNVFSPGALLRCMRDFQVTSFCAPPTVYRYFVKYGMNKVQMPCLEHLSTAGESLNPEVFRQAKEQTGITVCEGFGQTESVLMLANLGGYAPHPGSMGRPTPLYKCALVNEKGEPVPTGEVGELVVIPEEGKKQYGIFMGYNADDELYKFVWRGGVYHTGDTAWQDEEGYFWYVGRTDDLIKSRGFRVGPLEVENELMEHPAVLECAVCGVPDPDRGQAIKAYVVLADGYEKTPEIKKELLKFTNGRLAYYKRISILELCDEMPKTISGKIRRVELREAKRQGHLARAST